MPTIPASDYQWIALRLPTEGDDTFAKNGVTLTVADAIQQAYDDNAGASGQRMLALADVLEILASEIKWTVERQGDSQYDRSLLADRATYWRERAASGGSEPSGFTFVDVNRGDATGTDEFEQTL